MMTLARLDDTFEKLLHLTEEYEKKFDKKFPLELCKHSDYTAIFQIIEECLNENELFSFEFEEKWKARVHQKMKEGRDG